MSVYRFDTATIEQKLAGLLTAAGFKPVREFTAVDSLIYSDRCIGFYGLNEMADIGTAIYHDSDDIYTEVDCTYKIQLMGRSEAYTDYEDFNARCISLFSELAKDGTLLISSLSMGKACQSMPLKRLSRELTLKIRACFTDAEESAENSEESE